METSTRLFAAPSLFAEYRENRPGDPESAADAFFVFAQSLTAKRRRTANCFSLRVRRWPESAVGENMLGQFEVHVDAAEHDPREQSRNQHSGEQAGQNHEQQIVSRVYGSENEDRNPDEVDNAFARQFVIDLIGEPAEACAAPAPARWRSRPSRRGRAPIAATAARPSGLPRPPRRNKAPGRGRRDRAAMAMPKLRQLGRSISRHQRAVNESVCAACISLGN